MPVFCISSIRLEVDTSNELFDQFSSKAHHGRALGLKFVFCDQVYNQLEGSVLGQAQAHTVSCSTGQLLPAQIFTRSEPYCRGFWNATPRELSVFCDWWYTLQIAWIMLKHAACSHCGNRAVRRLQAFDHRPRYKATPASSQRPFTKQRVNSTLMSAKSGTATDVSLHDASLASFSRPSQLLQELQQKKIFTSNSVCCPA